MAPASLAPPQVRPFALAGAAIFGTAVGSLRIVFGRHFVTDVVFAGLITLVVVVALYRLLLDPIRRNDARLERGIERVSVVLHRLIGAALGAAGRVLAGAGSSLHSTGQHLHKRVACL
jgi:lipid A 4'-phosphatase